MSTHVETTVMCNGCRRTDEEVEIVVSFKRESSQLALTVDLCADCAEEKYICKFCHLVHVAEPFDREDGGACGDAKVAKASGWDTYRYHVTGRAA